MTKRDDRFDFYKFLLIIGVVLGHTVTAMKAGSECSVWLYTFVRTYDMPMFAFITGIFLRVSCEKHSMWENLANKLSSLLLPILIWNLFYNVICRQYILTISRFWYLWSILICTCMMIIVHGVTVKCKRVRPLFFGMIILLTHIGLSSYLDLQNVGFLLFPCVAGYYYNDIKSRIKSEKAMTAIKTCLIILFVLIQCFWSGQYNTWNTGCNIFAFGTPIKTGIIILFRALTGIVGCVVMKMFFDFIYDLLLTSKIAFGAGILRGGVLVGQHTMEIYILQSLLVETYGAALIRKIVSLLGFNPLVYNAKLLGWVLAPITAIISVVICYWIQDLLRKIPFIKHFVWGGTIKKWRALLKNR